MSSFCAVHAFGWGSEPSNGHLYFMSESIGFAILSFCIANMKYVTRLTEKFINISIAYAIVSFYGWILWMMQSIIPENIFMDIYLSYQIPCMFLYLMIIKCMLDYDGEENGNHRMDTWHNRLCFSNISDYSYKDNLQE